MDRQKKYIPGLVPEQRPGLDLGTVVLMGVITVASFSLMVLGALKLGELVRIALRWW
jgi:hypothetical protein